MPTHCLQGMPGELQGEQDQDEQGCWGWVMAWHVSHRLGSTLGTGDALSPLLLLGMQLLAPQHERPSSGALGRGCQGLIGAMGLALPGWHFGELCHPLAMPSLEAGRNKAKGPFPSHL